MYKNICLISKYICAFFEMKYNWIKSKKRFLIFKPYFFALIKSNIYNDYLLLFDNLLLILLYIKKKLKIYIRN